MKKKQPDTVSRHKNVSISKWINPNSIVYSIRVGFQKKNSTIWYNKTLRLWEYEYQALRRCFTELDNQDQDKKEVGK